MRTTLDDWLRRALSVLGRAARRYVDDDSLGMGAALAFYTVFSLGPLLVIATAVAAFCIGNEATREQLVSWARAYFGAEGAKAVQGMIAGALNRFSGFLATAVGLSTFFFGVTGAFGRLKHSLNVIWGVDHDRQPLAKRLLVTRLKALAAACLIGVMLFLGILLSAAVGAVGTFIGRWLSLPGGILFFANLVLSVLIVVPLFAVIFKFLPDTKVPTKSAWIGAAVAGVLFQAGALLVGAYLGMKVLASVYGASGSVLAVLLWSYYTAQTVLFGAEVCREVGRPRTEATAGEA